MSRCCSWPTPTPITWPSSTSRTPAAAHPWASSRSAGIPPRCGSPRDGKTIYVANGKGASSRANRDGPRPGFAGGRNPTQEYIGGLFQGTLSIIPMPAPRQMAALFSNRLRVQPAAARRSDRRRADRARARELRSRPRSASPSPIKYVVYIVKENRTYDQVFGDMKEGNGEPNICLFPEADHAQSPRPGPRVRAAGQFLRRERGQRRRP